MYRFLELGLLKIGLFWVRFACIAALGLSAVACSLFGVYKIDIPQGTPLTQVQAQKVAVGMTAEQVEYLLGSPTLNSALAPNRWDYLYDFEPGTYGKKADIPATHRQQRLSVYFGSDGLVEKVEGLQSIPQEQRAVPPTSSF